MIVCKLPIVSYIYPNDYTYTYISNVNGTATINQ